MLILTTISFNRSITENTLFVENIEKHMVINIYTCFHFVLFSPSIAYYFKYYYTIFCDLWIFFCRISMAYLELYFCSIKWAICVKMSSCLGKQHGPASKEVSGCHSNTWYQERVRGGGAIDHLVRHPYQPPYYYGKPTIIEYLCTFTSYTTNMDTFYTLRSIYYIK